MLTHGQMAFVIIIISAISFRLRPIATGRSSFARWSHGAGIHQLCQVARGATTISCRPRSSTYRSSGPSSKNGGHNLFAVPTIVKLLIEDPSVDGTTLVAALCHHAGAPMYRCRSEKGAGKARRRPVQYFGLGEVTGAITVLPPAFHSRRMARMRVSAPAVSSGRACSCRSRTRRQRSPGGRDRRDLRDRPGGFCRLLSEPEPTPKRFATAGFGTGDLGHVDAQGFLYITGRASDMFISGRVQRLSARDRGKAPDASGYQAGGDRRLPDPVWGEVGSRFASHVTVRRSTRPALTGMAGREDCPLQASEEDRVLVRNAKSAYGKDHQEADPRGTRTARRTGHRFVGIGTAGVLPHERWNEIRTRHGRSIRYRPRNSEASQRSRLEGLSGGSQCRCAGGRMSRGSRSIPRQAIACSVTD